MKKLLLFAACAVGAGFAKTAPAQYPLTATVEESRVVTRCGGAVHGASACHDYREVKALIDGHHFQLEARIDRGILDFPAEGILMLGDYKARVVAYGHSKPVYYQQTLELRYADGSTEKYEVVGEGR